MNTLWYTESTNDWNKALPLGNGFMGAMCFGGTLLDRFQLNNDSVWWGGPNHRVNPDAKKYLPKIRALLHEGKATEAEELAKETLSAIPDYMSHYEPLAEVYFIPDGKENIGFLGLNNASSGQLNRVDYFADYKRKLDIITGIHTVSYTKDETAFFRESFISYPDRVMAVKCEGTPLRILMERGSYCEKMYPLSDNTLCMEGQAGPNGVKYCLLIRAIRGNLGIRGRILCCEGDAEVLLASQTTFYCEDYIEDALRILDAAEEKGYAKLRKCHIEDVSELMNRCMLQLECEDRTHIPTDKRLEHVQQGGTDLGLINLAFAYGRYLLVASSRPGSLPANLQGIWNDQFLPPWDSKYTININTEMNYWPAEVTGLSELHQPLFDHMKRMMERGKKVAEEMYGARGWMAHHNTDIWGDCAPQDICLSSTYWQMGAAWLCLHALEHYRYTKDVAFLKHYLPMLKEAVLFFEDTLVENRKGQLVVSPTISPENVYRLPNGEMGVFCEGAAMDAQILYELLTGLMETKLLTAEERMRYKRLLSKLPKPEIEANGTIQEWAEPLEEWEPGHRHISHLFALYPGKQFFEEENAQELLVAARKTLERRLSFGGGHTGWSRAWIINLWARLKDGEKCGENVNALLQQSMLPNLLDNHPPFQIDGNFGLVSGIAEMLLQSHTGEIELLPALPEAWKNGKVTGLRTREGMVVDIEWRDGTVTSVHKK